MTQRRLLILSNVRTGSTWLEMAFGQLPGVSVDLEFKINPPFADAPHLGRITEPGFGMARRLEEIDPAAEMVGSKLTLEICQPDQSVDHEILRAIDFDGVSIIAITRDYPAILFSYVRLLIEGQSQNIDATGINPTDSNMDAVLANMAKAQPLERVGGLPDDVLRLYLENIHRNTLAITAIARRHSPSLVIGYDEIADRADDLAAFLKLDGAALRAAMDTAPVRRMKSVPLDQVILNYPRAAQIARAYADALVGELSD